MIVIACEKRGDLPWLRQLIQAESLEARPAAPGERWDLLVDRKGNVRSTGAVPYDGGRGRIRNGRHEPAVPPARGERLTGKEQI